MKPKVYVNLFGINLIRIKKRFNNLYKISILGIPMFSYETIDNKYMINFWLIYKIKEIFLKLHLKLRKQLFRKQLIMKYNNNNKIKVCLLTSRPGMWNFDYLYRILKEDSHFEPIPVVMPDPHQGKEVMLRYLDEAIIELQNKNLPVVSGWDCSKDEPLDLKNIINPDIILYVDFWKPHFYPEFYVTNFLDRITLLNGYGLSVMQDEFTCTFELNNLVDVYFRTTDMHKKMSEKFMKNKGKNVVVVGSPKLDIRFDESYVSKNAWKPQDKPKKRIIWAPHHSLSMPNNMYCYNSFLTLHDFMFQIAEKYKEQIQIDFRPHPMLRANLEKLWGKTVVDEYYEKWENLENGQISSGDFLDLFMQSDAMITDSCSFLAEYTAFNKQLFHSVAPTSRVILNEFGEELYNILYKPSGKDEGDLERGIEDYIKNVVLEEQDYIMKERTKLVDKYFRIKKLPIFIGSFFFFITLIN